MQHDHGERNHQGQGHRLMSLLRCLAMTVALIGLVAGGMSVTGCGTGGLDHGPGIPVFPDPQELEAIKQQPTPTDEQLFDEVGLDLSYWKFEGALPTATGYDTYAGRNLAALALRKHVDRYGRELRVTAGMSCAAHQLSWFLLTNSQLPSDSLWDFILARCGAGVGNVSLFTIKPSAPASSFTSTELSRSIEDAIVDAPASLGRIPAGSVLGAWAGAHDDQILIMIAYGKPSLIMEPLAMNAQGRSDVTVRGSMTGRIEHVGAVVTLGDGDFAECEDIDSASDDSREFVLRCPVAIVDSAALIDLIAIKKRRAVGMRELTLFVSPDGSMPDAYIEPVAPAIAGGEGPEEWQFSQIINDLRAQHQLSPVELELEQSQEVAQLLPHYIEASRSKARAELADKIMWHILAGTEVTHIIRGAEFLSFRVGLSGEFGMARALSRNIAFPMVRSVLLDPDADVIALAMRRSTKSEHAAIVLSTYDHLTEDAHPWLEEQLLGTLNRARKARGLREVSMMSDPWSNTVLDRTLGQLSGGLDLKGILDKMLKRLLWIHPDSTVGYSLQAIHPDKQLDVEWPEDLFRGDASVLLRTGYYSVPYSNWAAEILIVAYTLPGQSY